MNKTFLILVIFALSTLATSNWGCSSTMPVSNIKVDEFKGVSQIKKGEKASLKWSFFNAEKVRIKELQRNYNPIDSVNVSTDSNSIFNFVITKGTDTLTLQWRVFVDEKDETSIEITKLSEISDFAKPSYINSEYFRGTQSAKAVSTIKNLKVMRHEFPYKGMNFVRINALILDEFGNYVSGLSDSGSNVANVIAETGCLSIIRKSNIKSLAEISESDDVNVDFALLLDNSAIAGDYYPIYDEISSLLKSSSPNDRFALYNFNQNFKENIPLKSIKEINDSDIIASKAGGFSAIFKSLKFTIDKLNNSKIDKHKRVITLIAYSTDNASIIYDRNDIIEQALVAGIPIYVVAIGNAVDSYSLRSLAELSGARYYELEESELETIPLILNEIMFSQKHFYRFDIPVDSEISNTCSKISTNIEITSNNITIKDTLQFSRVKDRHEFNYMAIASFNPRDTLVPDEFNEPIETLADVMLRNPSIAVELIGNAAIEGDNRYCMSLGLRRAQAVRRLLIQLGVDPSKIRVRSDGSNNPLYYLQESIWMQYYNRRVELRWLDPSLLPFEIIAQIKETETDALSEVEKWEDKGYRSYFERYLQNNIPVYRVKIWGYPTLIDAEKTAKKLSSDNGYPFIVQ